MINFRKGISGFHLGWQGGEVVISSINRDSQHRSHYGGLKHRSHYGGSQHRSHYGTR